MQAEAIYSPTIMSGAVVRFQFGYDRGVYRDVFSGKERTDWSCEISASREGVCISGAVPIITDCDDLEQVKALLQRAWDIHEQMRHRQNPHEIAKRVVDEFNARVPA